MVTESQAKMDEYIEESRVSQKAIIKEIREEKDNKIERLKEAFNTLYEITMSNDDVFQRREHVIKIFGSQDDIDLWEQLKTFPEFIPSFKIG